MSFAISPFLGHYYVNQSATSNSTLYFSYRDQNGNYLDKTYMPGLIKMTFSYKYNPFIFLPNMTACGYINTQDTFWENKSCTPSFDRDASTISCSCQHMSFYSVIDDYLLRPTTLPITYLYFRNWSAFIAFLYIIIVFVIGLIYTFAKDHQDFRYINELEQEDGNDLEPD